MANIGQTMFRFCGALVLAGGATLVDHPQLWNGRDSTRMEMVPVVVAAQNIPGGTLMIPPFVTVARWPAGTQPAGAFDRLEAISGRVSRVGILEGQPILPGRLERPAPRPRHGVVIAPGKRAYAIRVNDPATFAGLIRPNSQVDVLVLRHDKDGRGRDAAVIVAEDIRVLRLGVVTGRSTDSSFTRNAVLMLEVTLEEAARIATAAADGQIQVMLRGQGDSVRLR